MSVALGALLGGIFVCCFLLVSLEIPKESLSAQAPRPFIRYVGLLSASLRGALYDQSLVSDPDPLFLPTHYNYGVEDFVPIRALRVVPDEDHELLDAELLLGEVNFMAEYQGGGYYIPRPIDLLSVDFSPPFGSFGQVECSQPEGSGDVGVYRFYQNEEIVMVGVLPGSMDEVLDATLWMPVNFKVQVENASWVGEALMVNSSGSEQVDRILQSFVRESDLAARLGDGYYRIEISP